VYPDVPSFTHVQTGFIPGALQHQWFIPGSHEVLFTYSLGSHAGFTLCVQVQSHTTCSYRTLAAMPSVEDPLMEDTLQLNGMSYKVGSGAR
jgi:hypothetical protein